MVAKLAKKIQPRTPKQFKTKIDDIGRVCTKCNEYKTWENFGETKTKKIITGRTSSCKQCKKEKRKAIGRDTTREKFCAKKRRKELLKENPALVKARDVRSRLLSRVTDVEHKRTTPTVNQLYTWLTTTDLICYYSKETLSFKTLTIDHKIPLIKGGSNELNNLCFASNHMNTAKGSMTDIEFFSLLALIKTWSGGGQALLRRLKQGYFG